MIDFCSGELRGCMMAVSSSKGSTRERGTLTENMLPPHQLQAVLSWIREHGYETLAAHWYYQHVKVTPLWEATDHLAFSLVLPRVSMDQYIGYALRRVPIRFNTELLWQVEGMREVGIHTLTHATFRPRQCVGPPVRSSYLYVKPPLWQES